MSNFFRQNERKKSISMMWTSHSACNKSLLYIICVIYFIRFDIFFLLFPFIFSNRNWVNKMLNDLKFVFFSATKHEKKKEDMSSYLYWLINCLLYWTLPNRTQKSHFSFCVASYPFLSLFFHHFILNSLRKRLLKIITHL